MELVKAPRKNKKRHLASGFSPVTKCLSLHLKLFLKDYYKYSTCDFLKRAITYFRYKPEQLQTDNGAEFTHLKKTDRTHPLDILCDELEIEHKRIRPRTPRHNGKVERSHRNDQERFYNHMSFYSYPDLLIQMKRYLSRSNRIPMQTLGWKSPLEKRHELMAQ